MATSYSQFVLLGDSLFQNSVFHQDGFSFQAAIQELCSRKLDVVNRGLSGWNSNNLLAHMDEIFPEPTKTSPKIKYLAILIGANDAVLPFSPTKQHCPVDEYKENLTKVVKHPRVKHHNPKILLVTPPPVDELKHGKLDKAAGISSPIRTSAISASYSEKAREVAKENAGVVLIDLWQALMDKAISMAPNDYQPGGPWLGSPQNGKAGGLDALLPDGLHMSGEAYRVFFDTLRPHIGGEWDGKEDDEVFVYPTWRKLQGVPDAAKVSVSDN